MEVCSTKKMMFLQLLTLIMLLPLLISSSYGEEAVNSSENIVCVSQQPYELEGKLPKFKDLNLCNVFHGKTCCSASSPMLSASLATHEEASKDCLSLFGLLECSICHPDVGTQPRPLRFCASFCDSVFEACSDAYFSASDQVIVPCESSNGTTICEKASKFESNGTAYCEAVGFTVAQTADDDSDEAPCHGSNSISVTVAPVLESLINTVRLQELMYKMLILSLAMTWMTSLFVLTSTLVNRLDYQMERGPRRLRRRIRNRRRVQLLLRSLII